MTPDLVNVELEQNILGALLVNNDAYPICATRITAADFAEPLHQRIYSRIAARISRDHIASPVTLKVDLDGDEALADVGGPAYLARLAEFAVALFAIRDHADQLAALGAKRRLADMLTQQIQALADPDKDAASVMGAIEAYGLGQGDGGGAEIIPFKRAILTAMEDAKAAYLGDTIPGVPLGITEMDRITGGLFPGDLCIVGGRPSMGKTGVALSGALGAARAGKGVVIASLEMTAGSLALRAISEATARRGQPVAYSDARRGAIEEHQTRALQDGARSIADLPIQIIPPHMRDIGAIYAATKRAAKAFEAKGTPLSLLIVDYLQLIRSSKQSRLDQITEISMALKGMAMQLQIPVVALSQLSRALESRDDKRPVMSDLRESGQIEQDADLILFCYRDEYYLRREGPPKDAPSEEVQDYFRALDACTGVMDVIIAKQRMGEIGDVRVRYDAATNLITDMLA